MENECSQKKGKEGAPKETSCITPNQRLTLIAEHLRIKVLNADEHIIVINKPSLLRSVPGNIKDSDYSQETSSSKKRPSVSMQQSWIEAIQFHSDRVYRNDVVLSTIDNDDSVSTSLDRRSLKANTEQVLERLSTKPVNILKSISRKGGSFQKYIAKNVKTILPHLMANKNDGSIKLRSADTNRIMIEEVSKVAFNILKRKSQSLYDTKSSSHRTKDEDSALGQLKLLRAAINMVIANENQDVIQKYVQGAQLQPINENDPIRVVHRLDCETSGLLVFARTSKAASSLSNAWRERKVSKVYLARVWHWPPFKKDGNRSGIIDLALAPSEHERLKWEVRDEELGGKPSQTEWKIVDNTEESTSVSRGKPTKPLTLEMKPITGRTHQLRIHCAHIGSGIIGDSLYGENPIQLQGDSIKEERPDISLRLHAYRLTFPHPETGDDQTHTCDHCWNSEE